MVFKTVDVVKAEGGVGFGQKGLMMELQSLQEALKVEIQIHQKLVAQMKQDPQNAELKLQLHDLQAKITALSERQKKVVEQLRRDLLVKQESAEIRLQTQTQLPLQADGKTTTLVSSQSQSSLPPPHLCTPQNSVSVTPIIATKTLPLMLRAATPTTPIAMMPTPTIAMVTTLTNTPLPSLPNSDPQNLPVSLQTSCKPTNQGMEPVRIVPKNTIVVQTTTQPIKVPQFVPPTRQTARPASLPQVMPKPPAPVAPVALQPVLPSPQTLQQPVYLTAKLSSTLLPSSGPVHQLHIFNPQAGPPNPQVGPPTPQAYLNNTKPGAAIIQPSASSTQPGPAITQTSATIAMTLSTNISQFNTSSVHHSGYQLPCIHISAQPSKPQTAPPEQPSKPQMAPPEQPNKPHTSPTEQHSKHQTPPPEQSSPASTCTDTLRPAQNSEPCLDTMTLSAVCRVEPKTGLSSPTLHPAALQSPTSPTATHTHGPAVLQSPVPKHQDSPLKLAFMVSLGLVTHDYLEEIQSKRQERKRRTTANPVYSGAVFEPERKKSTVSYLNSANQGCRKRANEDSLSEVCHIDVWSSVVFSFYFFFPLSSVSSHPGRPPKHSSAVERGASPLTPTSLHAVAVGLQQPGVGGPHPPAPPLTPSSHPPPFSPRISPSSVGDGDIHDDFCMVCRRSGQLLMCDTCSRVYHLDCLAPALRSVPKGMWICPSCQNQISKKEETIDWPGPLAIVHSYISYKAEREQEKQKLEKWSSELRQEREELELRVKQLSDSITICRESRNGVLARQKEMEASIDKVKSLVCLIRGIQLPNLPMKELPLVAPTVLANGDLDRTTTQQPSASCEENHPDMKCSISRLVIIGSTAEDVGESMKPSSCLKDTGTAHTHTGAASSADPAVDTTGRKNSSASNCPPLSNSHIRSTVVTSANGALEPEEDGPEESGNRNAANDINKNNADVNRNSIRDFRGSPEPPLPAVMPL